MEIITSQRRIVWGAVFAGALIILIAQLFFGLLGLSFGIGSINPAQETTPFKGVGLGLVLWFGVTSLLTLFMAGWVSARLAAVPGRFEGAMHGVLGWGLATLTTFMLLTTALGTALRTTTGIAGSLIGLVGQGAGTLVKQGVEAVAPEIDVSHIKKEARALLNDAKIEREANRAIGAVKSTAREIVMEPQDAGAEIDALLDKFFTKTGSLGTVVDRDSVVNALVLRTGMNRLQAERTVSQWETTFHQAKMKVEALAAMATEKARQTAQSATDAIATTSRWTAFFLLLGFVAAAVGGIFGSPSEIMLERTGVRRTTDFDYQEPAA